MNKILVIDDDDDIRFLVRMSLGKLGGKTVLEAADLETGVELTRRESPDVVLLDNDLNGDSGLQYFEKCPERTAPVILLSARNDTPTIQPYLDAGARGHIRKPFDVPTLLAQIETIISG